MEKQVLKQRGIVEHRSRSTALGGHSTAWNEEADDVSDSAIIVMCCDSVVPTQREKYQANRKNPENSNKNFPSQRDISYEEILERDMKEERDFSLQGSDGNITIDSATTSPAYS